MIHKKLAIITIAIWILFITGCCNEDDVEVARYKLTPYELNLIPYTLGQKVVFEHSNGYEFNAYVEQIATEWKQYYDFCEWFCCGQEYFSYQTKQVILQSSYPNFRMRFKLSENFYGEYWPMYLHFDINHRHVITMPYDSLGGFLPNIPGMFLHDTITISGEKYRGVVEKDFDFHMFINSEDINTPKTIFYNNSVGLIQIKMSNDETFTIKP